jgi:hypothetical protein
VRRAGNVRGLARAWTFAAETDTNRPLRNLNWLLGVVSGILSGASKESIQPATFSIVS